MVQPYCRQFEMQNRSIHLFYMDVVIFSLNGAVVFMDSQT